MGEVWKVQHVHTLQYFALKTLRVASAHDEPVSKRFLQEARIAAAIQSRNVVRIVDVNPEYVHQGELLPFIAMELVNGPSLMQVLEAREKISLPELLWTLEQVGGGLAHAHALGIVHRDLKPSNILISTDADGSLSAKICDFGIAKVQSEVAQGDASIQLLSTETGTIFGTPRYMAPEQLVRSGRTVAATDQWAMALLAFRCLAGHDYFDRARNGAEMVLAIVHDALERPSAVSLQLSDAFDEWFLRSCAREPLGRFPDVASQLRALKSALGGLAAAPIDLRQATPTEAGAAISNTKRLHGHSLPKRFDGSRTSSWRWQYYPAVVASIVFAIVGTHWIGRQVRSRAAFTGSRIAADSRERQSFFQANLSLGTSQQSYSATPAAQKVTPVPAPTTESAIASVAPLSSAQMVQRSSVHIKKPGRSILQGQLPMGAPCTRSMQCKEGACLADTCQ